MGNVNSSSKLEVNITLNLSEEEARALQAITVYGSEAFLTHFYNNLGKYYLEPHQKGLISLFETIGKELPQHLSKANEARKIWKK